MGIEGNTLSLLLRQQGTSDWEAPVAPTPAQIDAHIHPPVAGSPEEMVLQSLGLEPTEYNAGVVAPDFIERGFLDEPWLLDDVYEQLCEFANTHGYTPDDLSQVVQADHFRDDATLRHHTLLTAMEDGI